MRISPARLQAGALNPEANLAEVQKDLAAIGYPMAAR